MKYLCSQRMGVGYNSSRIKCKSGLLNSVSLEMNPQYRGDKLKSWEPFGMQYNTKTQEGVKSWYKMYRTPHQWQMLRKMASVCFKNKPITCSYMEDSLHQLNMVKPISSSTNLQVLSLSRCINWKHKCKWMQQFLFI